MAELVPLRYDQPLKQLNRIAKRPPVDIEFQDLLYSVRDSHSGTGKFELFFFLNETFFGNFLVYILYCRIETTTTFNRISKNLQFLVQILFL